jgi:8-hydroxy-5-deazaflavin:NADPH oxidoreductase
MKIGILGGGNVGGSLGIGWALYGHQVCFGVREPHSEDMKSTLAKMSGRGTAGAPAEAALFGEVVVNALPWPVTKEVLSALDLKGKILLDCTNPLLPNLAGLEVGTTTSGGEQVAQWAPGAAVVKIFNTTGFGNMANPVFQGQATPMLYCGDDAAAKQTASALASQLGFHPVDAGPLTNARLLEPHALLWIWLANFGGLSRDFAFQIVKR